jgi:flagellar hook protein FlgE
MGFAQGVSGLNASASNLDVIGNNIANSGTVGFKSGNTLFSDVYAGSRVGLGTRVAAVVQNFSAGAVQSSTRGLDVAIVNGDGFFRLASPSGEVMYSRNGQFDQDADGFIVNAGGLRLTGYQLSANGTVAGGTPGPLQLPTGAMAPNATQSIVSQYNLDSRLPVPAAAPFDANNSATYSYSNPVKVYDSLGNSHEIATFFVKTGPNAWSVYATADGYPLNATGGMIAAPTPAGPPVVANSAPLATGTLSFDTNGNLVAGAPSTLVGGKINFAGLNFANGSSALNFSMDLTSSTQFGNANDPKKLTQDGFTSGQLTAFAINEDGTITGKYSNEQTQTLGQVVLSSFVNPNGLQPKGDNVWAETAESGQPLTGAPGSGTKLGALASGAVEASNVDLTAELVNLIIAQRTYQANAQTVKTQDQVMQTLVNMR